MTNSPSFASFVALRKTATVKPSATIANDVARRNGLPKLPTLKLPALNANTALGPTGGGIGGGGAPPGALAYGMTTKLGEAEGIGYDAKEALRATEQQDAETRAGRRERGRDYGSQAEENDEKRRRIARRQYLLGDAARSPNGLAAHAGFEQAEKLAMPFLAQRRPAKVKEIYRALVREHPEMGAEMKARIAIRKGRRSKQARKSPQHGGPPYRAPLSSPGAGGAHLAKVAAAFRDERTKLAFRELARDVVSGAAVGAGTGALKGAADAKKGERAKAALRAARDGAMWGAMGGVVKHVVNKSVSRVFDKRAELRERFADLKRRVRAWDDGGACLSGETLLGGKGDGKPDSAFPATALRAGMQVEREHVTDPRMRKEIAKDHLTEDRRYYQKLRRMEKTATKKQSLYDKLKAAATPLTPEERAIVMARGAVWHHGPNGAESPAIRKSVVDGETTYWCATHRAWDRAPTLAGAIQKFKFIKTTA